MAQTTINSAGIKDLEIVNADIKDDTITEAKLDIHAAPTGTDKYLKYTSNGMEWVVGTNVTHAANDITEAMLEIHNDPATDKILGYTSNGMEWVVDGSTTSLPLTGGSLSGDLAFSDAGEGVSFAAQTGASGAASQKLDWYEHGTWTPGFSGFGSPSISLQIGSYVRTGRQVTCNFHITYTGGTASSSARITGLPFAHHSTPGNATGKNLTGFCTTNDCAGDKTYLLMPDTSVGTSIHTHILGDSSYNSGYIRGTLTMHIDL